MVERRVELQLWPKQLPGLVLNRRIPCDRSSQRLRVARRKRCSNRGLHVKRPKTLTQKHRRTHRAIRQSVLVAARWRGRCETNTYRVIVMLSVARKGAVLQQNRY